jgi:uncharacterized protein (DUF1800 family)
MIMQRKNKRAGIRGLIYCQALATLLCAATLSLAAPAPKTAPLSEQQKVLQALNRLSFGPRPGDVEAVQKMGLQNWIDAQLNPQSIDDSAVDKKFADLKLLQMSQEDLMLAYAGDRGNIARRIKEAQNGTVPVPAKQLERYQAIQKALDDKNIQPGTAYEALGELINAKLLRSVESNRQLQEVLVDFWSNHFNIDAKKNEDAVLLINWEQNVIRPNVFGNFRDLLEATAKSPAMLEYLDNASSMHNPDQPAMTIQNQRRGGQGNNRGRFQNPQKRPANTAQGGFQKTAFEFVADNDADNSMMAPPAAANSSMPDFVKNPAQQGAKGKGGLNENYGRELMELHTLGVNGGYSQEDVINVARCFTGWTYDRKTGEFIFRPYMHDNGTKTVLGHVIPPGGGIKDGEQVLDILASAPATAHHLSYELCQRLVSDTPPAALVDRVAGVWKTTNGDLKAVVRAIVTSPEFYSPAVYRDKIKSPYEYVVSSARALGGSVIFPDSPTEFRQMMRNDGLTSARQNNRGYGRGQVTTLAQQIATIGQPIFSCLPPTGYSENSQDWVSTGALVARLNYALTLANGNVENVLASPSSLLLSVSEEDKAGIQQNLIEGILHVPVSAATQNTLARETSTGVLVDRRKLTALIIGSPEFQRR